MDIDNLTPLAPDCAGRLPGILAIDQVFNTRVRTARNKAELDAALSHKLEFKRRIEALSLRRIESEASALLAQLRLEAR